MVEQVPRGVLTVARLVERLGSFDSGMPVSVGFEAAPNRAVIDVETDTKGWPTIAFGARLGLIEPAHVLTVAQLAERLGGWDSSLPVVVGFDDYHYLPNRGVNDVTVGPQGEPVLTFGAELDNPAVEP